jgi:cytochrome P450
MAEDLVGRLPTDRSVDLLQHFAMPWCLRLGLTVTRASPGDAERLSKLTDLAFWGTGLRRRAFLRRRRAARAVAELQRYFAASTVPLAQSTFLGIVQTLPRLLASGWLALFRHPAEVARLRADPGLMPLAVEELLRYAGIIPRLFRKATTDVDLGPLRLAVGERVTLMVASANRDPEHFPDPDRVDLSRPATGQLSLGIGRCSCAGARLVRMAFSVSITTILATFQRVGVTEEIRWQDDHLCWPRSVPVTLRR